MRLALESASAEVHHVPGLERIDPATIAIRSRLMEVALEQVRAGCHYLTESAGAVPGESDRWRGRSVRLAESADWSELGIHTAVYQSGAGGRGPMGCAGRYSHAEVNGIVIPPRTALEQEVRDYLEANSALPFDQWPKFQGRGFPRKAWNQERRQYFYVVGEDCRNKKHFDCILFVNWVISEVMGRPITFNDRQWQNPRVAPVSVSDRSELVARDMMAGDMVLRDGGSINHMAFCDGEGNLVEAAGAASGVRRIAFSSARGFTHHLRLRNRFLRGAPE